MVFDTMLVRNADLCTEKRNGPRNARFGVQPIEGAVLK